MSRCDTRIPVSVAPACALVVGAGTNCFLTGTRAGEFSSGDAMRSPAAPINATAPAAATFFQILESRTRRVVLSRRGRCDASCSLTSAIDA